MNINELNELNEIKPIEDYIRVEHLSDEDDRTLLYGYDCERNTWHTYLKDSIFYHVVYDSKGLILRRENYGFEIKFLNNIIPNKRLYPECCDFEFCKLLKEKGVHLPFTTWSNKEYNVYYGKTIE